MRFYTRQHQFYCGIDLHARLLAVCVLDQAGKVVCQTTIAADKQILLDTLAPFRKDVVVCVESLFAWYWVADLCEEHAIPFVLGHALYMKAIHGGKSKTDRIDAAKIAGLLRGGLFPQAYVYPKALRETRDLLRRRTFLVRQRAQVLTHVINTNSQYNLPTFPAKLSYKANRANRDAIVSRFPHQSVRHSIGAALTLI